ncbi:MAG: DUF2270 domain-containing protein [Pseudomonadota bacterium]
MSSSSSSSSPPPSEPPPPGSAGEPRKTIQNDDPYEWETPPGGTGNTFDGAEIGALAHLYRGEVYRSTTWRTRLDTTTNWSVVTLGLALSISYASPDASALPLLIIGLLTVLFLVLESRRYRYFNVWRARARWIETHFYAPMLQQSHRPRPGEWQDVLAQDYLYPEHHISFWRAVGRRLRRNYVWIFSLQAFAYFGKIAIHPTPMTSLADGFARAQLGPVPGAAVMAAGVVFHASWIALALYTWRLDRAKHGSRRSSVAMG